MRRTVIVPVLLALLAASLALGALSVRAQGSEYTLTIMHTSENHGHWEPFTQTISVGGIARRATLVKQIRSEGVNALLLDAGDVSQGTLYFVQHRMAEGAQFYNALGYDAVAIGNHEFDLGPKTFAENWVANAKFSIVSTDLDFSSDPLLDGKIPPYVIKTVGGEKIGLLGFTTDDVVFNSSMGPSIRLKPRIDAAKAAIAELQQQGVNKIIALSHLGYPEDRKLAAAIDGIDVIVSGHTFTLLGDPAKLDKSLGVPEGPYPTAVTSPGGKPVLIVHAYQWGELLGRLNVTFDSEGVPVRWGGDPVLVDNSVTEDADVAALQRKLAEPLTILHQSVIGKSDVDLDGSTRVVRGEESALGDLIADAMLEATASDQTQVAMMNGGGIRSSIKAGDITVGNVLEVLPFGNRLVQMNIKGADLLAALENGVSQVSQGAGRFPQVAGLRFTFDPAKPAGQRVRNVGIGSVSYGFAALDPNATYRLVTNDFMAGGGDGYEVLKTGTNVRGGDIPLDSALLDYIKAHGVIATKVQGRIIQSSLPPAVPTNPPSAVTVAPPTPTRPPAATATAQPRTTAAANATPAILAQANAAPTPSAQAADNAPTLSSNYIWLGLIVAVLVLFLIRDWRGRRMH
jgi:5'-nucleotidase / UDP-sugar diphosphatase